MSTQPLQHLDLSIFAENKTEINPDNVIVLLEENTKAVASDITDLQSKPSKNNLFILQN